MKKQLILYNSILCLAFAIPDTSMTKISSNTLDSSQILSTDKPAYNTQLEISMDSLFVDDELFDLRMSDAKELFSEPLTIGALAEF